ncbi:MAG: ATP-binding cassette domain-containing protein [Alphaproteobacteria bacterium]|nr:ATP-binding cassette domain-containing protein [Alphaproteobacteria bacterium]
MVRLEHVGKRYAGGPDVLRDVSLALPSGSFRFLTGPSGAGKTTLIKLLSLAEPPSRGLVNLLGIDPATLDRDGRAALRQRIGVVPQDFGLLPYLSIRDNVALPLRISGRPEPEIVENVPELLRWIGLADKMDAYPATLSDAERQRAAVARAIVRRPDLLLADEPTATVNDERAAILVRVFERINRLGTTVLIGTHNIAFARRFTHPRLHLEAGVLSGPVVPP